MIVNPAIFGGGEHYSSMPFTSELAALFEPDSLNTANSLWRNKITGGYDMALVGGEATDNALLLGAGEYGHVSAPQFPFSMYLVVKKPENDDNKFFCGSAADRPSSRVDYTFANNGNSKDSFFELIAATNGFTPYLLYYYTDQNQSYHVASFTVIDNPYDDSTGNVVNSSTVHFMVDNVYFGSVPTIRDITGTDSYRYYNETIALNGHAVGNKGGTISYTDYAPVKDSYYRAFAFGGKQTLEQMQANHKYLYERYCT